MREMKKLIFTLSAVLFLGSAALTAQSDISTHPERNANAATRTVENQAKAETERMVELLDLSPEQERQMLELFLSVIEKRKEVRDRYNNRSDDMAKALMKINSQRSRDIIKILTPEQNEAYKASQVRTP